MKRIIVLLFSASIVSTVLAQTQTVAPFKLGTFQLRSRTFVGIVIGDSVVVDLAAASRAITPASNIMLPADMKDLITRYDTGLRDRIVQVVRSVNARTAARPAYVYELTSLKTMPPIMYPTTMWNVVTAAPKKEAILADGREPPSWLRGGAKRRGL